MFKTCLETFLEIALTVGLADFVAGIVHWIEDAYVRESTPVLGTWIGKPNIIHHHLPRHFTQFNWWHSSYDLFYAACIFVAGAWAMVCLTWEVWLFAAIGANANQVHKWAHRTRAENGPLISLLQDLRVLQTPAHHAAHHANPKNCQYCPVTNFLNPALDRAHFWEALEWILARTIGLRRRPDTSLPNAEVPAWIREMREEPEPISAATGPKLSPAPK